jgi:hypothetical protein
VLRIDAPFYDVLDDYGGRTLVVIEEGETLHELETHSGLYRSTMEVFVDAVTKYEPDSIDELTQTSESRSTIRSKLIADVVLAIMADDTLGHFAKYGTRITDDAPLSFHEIDKEDWTGVQMRFEVRYVLDESSP